VTGVISAGEAGHQLCFLGQEVDYLPFTFVSPLPSHNSYYCHLITRCSSLFPQVNQPLTYGDKDEDHQNTYGNKDLIHQQPYR
jgi:hypothetical protein